MKPEVEQAAKRVLAALDGLHPRNHNVTVIDEEGNRKMGLRTPLAEVDAADVQTLCNAVPLEVLAEKTDEAAVIKMLAKGTRRFPAGTMVLNQSQCLWKLLKAAAGLEPPKVDDPNPDDWVTTAGAGG